MGIEIAYYEGICVGIEKRLESVLRKLVAGAAGRRWNIYIEDVEGGAANGGGDALDFEDWVAVEVGG